MYSRQLAATEWLTIQGGLLGAALYDPVFVEGITSPATLALAVAAFVAGTMWKVPAWTTVIGAGAPVSGS